MQTFARKTVTRADRRWSQVLPFLVFAFGSVYAVAQFYFILQVPITRIDLSIIVNATVFAAGIFTMMFLIRRHLGSVELDAYKAKIVGQSPIVASPESAKPRHSLFGLPWKKASTPPEPQPELQPEPNSEEAASNEQVAEPAQPLEEPSVSPSETISEPTADTADSDDQDY